MDDRRSPFKIDGPTSLRFSGGRTSGLMLKRTLEANNAEDLHRWLFISFNNTGKEEEATLRFVDDCDRHFCKPMGLHVTWLEYRAGPSFAVVDYCSASRDGEPYRALLEQRIGEGTAGLPNVVNRYCSSELKTRTTHRYLRSIGWTEWDSFVGYRADEPRRYMKLRGNPHPEVKAETVSAPLVPAGVAKADVGTFWRAQPFDLGLPNVNGVTYHGNCDLCFLKHPTVVRGLVAERPSRAIWWIAQERYAESMGRRTGARFADDRESFQAMAAHASEQGDAFGHIDNVAEMLPCECGDDA